jgi:PAS domain S-box-containing protein
MATYRIRILVVDDEPDICTLVKEHLDSPGDIEVHTCHSVSEARKALSTNTYDAVVSDYQMPEEDGISFLKSLRAKGDRIPFIILTGKSREELVIDALNSGADAYLLKGGKAGIPFAELSHHIHAAVRRYRTEESTRSHNEELRVVNEELESAEVELRAQLGEIVRAQEELGKEMAFSESLMDSLPGIFYLYEAESLRLVRWNKNHQQVSGYSPEEMIGKHVLSWHLPDNSEAVLAAINSCMEDGQASIEAPLLMKDGRQIPFLLTARRFDTKDTSFFMGLGMDIGERIEAERTLRESEVMHRAILDNAGLALGYWTVDGNLIFTNSIAADYLGGKPEDFIGCNVEDLFGELGKTYLERIKMAITSDKPNEYEDLVCLSGRELWLLSVFTHVPGPTEEESGILIFSHDITERKYIEMALHLANRKLNLLSSITRHDINNQLVALTGYLSLLEGDHVSVSSEQRLIKARTAAERISSMIQFTKEYEDIGENLPTWQDVRSLVERSSAEVCLGHVRLQNEVPSGIEWFADPLIIKVFHNLVDNALRHGWTTTLIRFYVDEKDGTRSIVCEDDGAGIPVSMKKILFARGTGKDHGFGLFLSREILSITGIQITEEGSTGSGARFVMRPPKGGLRDSKTSIDLMDQPF